MVSGDGLRHGWLSGMPAGNKLLAIVQDPLDRHQELLRTDFAAIVLDQGKDRLRIAVRFAAKPGAGRAGRT